MRSRRVNAVVAIAAACASTQALAAATGFTGIGGGNTSVSAGTANAAMTAFEAAIGGADNGSGTGIYTNGFRSIRWDGVPDAYAAPNLLPANYFNTTSPHGVVLIAPSAGVQVSARSSSGTPVNFGNINSNYTTNFSVFSPERLFAPIGTNVVVIYFYAAGTNSPAFVRGFGSVFDDVEFSNTTSIQYFGLDGADLGTFFAPVGANKQAEFLGILFAPSDPLIGHVVISLGNAALGATTVDGTFTDVVVMDDIAYSEPRADLIFADGFD